LGLHTKKEKIQRKIKKKIYSEENQKNNNSEKRIPKRSENDQNWLRRLKIQKLKFDSIIFDR
jgi:hypothetical protein